MINILVISCTWDSGHTLVLIIAAGGWIFALVQRHLHRKDKQRDTRQNRRQQMVDKVIAHVNRYGELCALYNFLARMSSHLVKDEAGQFVKDADGKYVKQVSMLEPEPRFEKAMEDLHQSDIKSAIAQKIVEIKLKSSEIFDILTVLDQTGSIKKELGELHYKAIRGIEFWIEHKDFKLYCDSLREAKEARQSLRQKLEEYLK